MKLATISIFGLPSCPHCVYVKSIVTSRFPENPLSMIDVQNYPSRRADMISLTSKFTVPQVFVNENYVGGRDDFCDFTGMSMLDEEVPPRGDMSWFLEEHDISDWRLRPVCEEDKVMQPRSPPYEDLTDYVSAVKESRKSRGDANSNDPMVRLLCSFCVPFVLLLCALCAPCVRLSFAHSHPSHPSRLFLFVCSFVNTNKTIKNESKRNETKTACFTRC